MLSTVKYFILNFKTILFSVITFVVCQHIQLTTQMYVLAQGSDDYQPMVDLSKKMLVSCVSVSLFIQSSCYAASVMDQT